MTKVTYTRTSPYFTTQQITKYLEYLDYWSGTVIPPTNQDTLMILDSKYKQRPDLLAFDLYGTPQLWWVFMVRNPDVIRDPIWDFQTGIVIYTPPKTSLSGYI